MASTDLTVIEKSAYLALSATDSNIMDVIAENLGDDEITERDLPRIAIPASGGTKWTIPGPFGEDLSDELTGIIVHFKRTRQYWTNPDPTGEPPICKSPDARTGFGSPGGDCKTCPLAQFGSHPKDGSNAQACTERELWFLLREGAYLPTVLSLSPSSLNIAKDYRFGQLGTAGIKVTSVVTRITLKTETAGGNRYSVIVPTVAARLDQDAAEASAGYAQQLKPILDRAAAAMVNEPAAGSARPPVPTPSVPPANGGSSQPAEASVVGE